MRLIKKGSTDVSVELFIVKDTDGTPKTDGVANTIVPFYRRGISATQANLTPSDLAAVDSTHTDWGIKHVSDGSYRLDLPDAAFASGVDVVHIGATVTNGVALPITIQLVAFDPQDTVRLGQTALPNAAADAAGGLPISDAGGLDLDGLNTNVGTINTTTGTINTTANTINTTANTINTNLTTVDGIVDTINANLTTVDGIVDDILVDTNSLNDTKIPDTLSLANINAQVDTAIETYNLDHLLSAAVTGSDVADNSVLAKLVSKSATADWDDFVNTQDSLQATSDTLALVLVDTDATIPNLINGLNDFNPSSDTVANVTNVATCASNTDMRGTESAATAAALTTMQGNVTDILEDTNQTLPATLSTIDGIVDLILEDSGTTLLNKLNDIYANTNTDIPATLSTINTNTSGTSTSISTLTSNLAVVDNNVDSILTGVVTNIPTSLAAILEDTQTTLDDKIDNLTTNLTATDTVVDQIRVNTNTDIPTLINALNDFNPSTDTVANVTTVGTCTTNSDMRGTDNAALATAVSTLASAVTVIDGLVDDIKAAVITTLPGLLATIDTVVDLTLEDTGTTLPTTLTSITNSITALQSSVNTVDGIVDDILLGTGSTSLTTKLTTIEGKVDTVDTVVDSIKVNTTTDIPATLTTMTNSIGTINTATGTSIPASITTLTSKVDVVDGNVDDIETATTGLPSTLTTIGNNVSSILTDTETTLDGKINTINTNVSSILADTNELQGDLADGGRLDLILDDILSKFAATGETSGAWPVSATFMAKIDRLYYLTRNKTTQTATERKHFADDGSTVINTVAVSDDGTTFTRGEIS